MGVFFSYLIAAFIGFLLYRAIKPKDRAPDTLTNHLKKYSAYAAICSAYTGVSPFYRYHPVEFALAMALIGIFLVFALFIAAGFITWLWKSRRSLNSYRVTSSQTATAGDNEVSSRSRINNGWNTTTRQSTTSTTRDSITESNAVYEVIAQEIESGQTDKGLWTRIYAECDGDETRTKVQYIRQRHASLVTSENPPNSTMSEHPVDTPDAASKASKTTSSLDQGQGKASSRDVALDLYEASRKHGIFHHGGKFFYGKFSYDRLDDAVAYAEKVSTRTNLRPNPNIRKFGNLTSEQIEYLEYPILAINYLKKYRVSKDALATACANKKIKSAWDNDILWVQDLPIERPNGRDFGHSNEFHMIRPKHF